MRTPAFRSSPLVLAVLLGAASRVSAQDAGTTAAPPPSGTALVGRGCEADTVPAEHSVTVETRVLPSPPTLGDRVQITYRFVHARNDAVEFEPDPVAFAQPGRELEYARRQPERDRSSRPADGGRLAGEVTVAVQPFQTGEVVIAPQLARLRASGDVYRVCTPEVRFRVRDPFGNEPHPAPRDLTAPVPVTEDGYRLRFTALALDLLFVVVTLTLLVNAWLRSRPKPVPPPPPPEPAWITALRALDALGRSDLLSRGATKDYYDAVSDIVRRYVGALCGFDAIESTTDEVLAHLKRIPLPGVANAELAHLLGECDLVKFARYVPTHEESESVLGQAYSVIRRSSPAQAYPPTSSSGGPPAGTGPIQPPTDARRA